MQTIGSNGQFLVPNYDIHLLPTMAFINPRNGRKSWTDEEDEARRTRVLGGFKIGFAKYPVKIDLQEMHSVNDVGRDILAAADGTKTAQAVCDDTLALHDHPAGEHEEGLRKFINAAIERNLLLVSPEPRPTAIRRTGSTEYCCPVNVSVELTARCNIRCIHCYGRFGEPLRDEMSGDELIAILADLRANGCRQVELTGGECTIHPEFDRILKFACENFNIVGILTNGVAISDRAFEIMIAHADHALAQICINGDEEYHNKFCKSPIAYQRATKSIRRLAQGGVLLRCPINVTVENAHMVEEVAETVRALGATGFGVNICQEYGRMEDAIVAEDAAHDHDHTPESGCVTCPHMFMGKTCRERDEINQQALAKGQELGEKYPGFVQLRVEGDAERLVTYIGNCGAGNRTLYVRSDGRVQLCPMSADSGIPYHGNLRTSSLADIMRGGFAQGMGRLRAPHLTGACVDCAHAATGCWNCVLSAVRQYMKTPDECPWGQQQKLGDFLSLGLRVE